MNTARLHRFLGSVRSELSMTEESGQKPKTKAPASEVAPVKGAPASKPEETSLGEKAMTNKELKELKKLEKAAKRSAQKAAIGISPEQQEQIAKQKIEKKKAATTTQAKKQLDQTVIKDVKKIPSMFSHLETREQRNAASPAISHIVHPAILALTLKYSTYKIVGSSTRLKAMLEAFKEVVKDYQTPSNTTLTRNLTGHFSHQIEYLTTARPLSVSMGNAIRWLKQEISLISIDISDIQAKEILCNKIDEFIREKIDLSDQVIVKNASKHIVNGSTILTFGHSQVLELLFKHCAIDEDKKFNLIIVDSRPLFEGRKLLNNLVNTNYEPTEEELKNGHVPIPITQTNIKITYVLISSVSSSTLEDVDCVLLGAHAMLSNGRLYSRVGTALIAMMAHTRNIPVLTCCESVKFSDKVQLDSVTTNELADPDDLVHDIESKKPPQKKSFALEQFLKNHEAAQSAKEKPKQQQQQKKADPGEEVVSAEPLADWKNMANVNILNLMYDLTPPEYIKKVITELGALPPSSVPVILREYKNT